MNYYIDFNRVKSLSDEDKVTPLSDRMLKIFEELGEASQAVLKYKKSTNASKSAKGSINDVNEELCDIINSTFDVVFSLGISSKDFNNMFSHKLDKWGKKMKLKNKNKKKDKKGIKIL